MHPPAPAATRKSSVVRPDEAHDAVVAHARLLDHAELLLGHALELLGVDGLDLGRLELVLRLALGLVRAALLLHLAPRTQRLPPLAVLLLGLLEPRALRLLPRPA